MVQLEVNSALERVERFLAPLEMTGNGGLVISNDRLCENPSMLRVASARTGCDVNQSKVLDRSP